MSVCSIYNRDPDRRKTWFVKGAPEIILKSCFALQTQDGRQSMTDKIRRNFMGEFRINQFSDFIRFRPYFIQYESYFFRRCQLYDAART